ncbi:MAG: hypothetical protein OXH57_11590, partial [Ekhidna sp.]|nr:hypothetical protein [Ekhidna sp.]
GNFPIGFKIWNTANHVTFKGTVSDVYDENGDYFTQKTFTAIEKKDFINKWVSKYKVESDFIGFLAGTNGNDFQQNGIVYILNEKEQMANPRGIRISSKNLIQSSIYYAVRRTIKQTWLNDRDQFLYPNDGWKKDRTFQNDCLVFTLFHGQNRISSKQGTNYWIPFTEQEVDAREKFESNFMTQFVKGKIKTDGSGIDLFSVVLEPKPEYRDRYVSKPALKFSKEASEVFDAGRSLWKYYHQQPNCNVNASLYDIREHFQGRSDRGQMNSKSDDLTYVKLITELRSKLKLLADKITPKVYEYGFLKN